MKIEVVIRDIMPMRRSKEVWIYSSVLKDEKEIYGIWTEMSAKKFLEMSKDEIIEYIKNEVKEEIDKTAVEILDKGKEIMNQPFEIEVE